MKPLLRWKCYKKSYSPDLLKNEVLSAEVSKIKSVLNKKIICFLIFASLLVVFVLTPALLWATHDLALKSTKVEFRVVKGSSSSHVIESFTQAGIRVSDQLFKGLLWLTATTGQVKPGTYIIQRGESPLDLWRKLVNGDQAPIAIRFIEGWTFQQFRDALAKNPNIRQDTKGFSGAEIMQALGYPGQNPEGQFFPDTYLHARGESDLKVLQHAMDTMTERLQQAWLGRKPGLPYNSPRDALILASIVEKETNAVGERAKVAAVFVNRLKMGMRLQSDPTVIYGLGTAFDGNLRKKSLLTDTLYNSYTRTGLPPTPISAPGMAALQAVMHPAPIEALYFVAKGDGTSHFSNTLTEHNRAVRKYQLAK
jgi:UPF0755 protein